LCGRKARALDEIDERDRNVAEFLAGASRRFDIAAGEFGAARDDLARIALHEREIQRPPCKAKQRHPEQLAFQKEAQHGHAPIQQRFEHRDVDPALMVRYHHVMAIAFELRFALDHQARMREPADQVCVERVPAFRRADEHAIAEAAHGL